MKKDIFCGSGKRFICLALFCSVLFISLHVTSYAAQPGEKEEKLQVSLYDSKWRKVLIREGNYWGVEQDVFLSVPVEEISKEGGKIEVIYTDDSSKIIKKYRFYCYRK